LRAIDAIGYDMDYTLIHYREDAWEHRSYEHLKLKLTSRGWPVHELSFDAEMMVRGLVLDINKGNILETNRFGYVKQALHGTQRMNYRAVRRQYARTIVSLREERFVFLNTLFSLSEGCMYAQAVDLLDANQLPEVLGYSDLYWEIRSTLDKAHMEGELKAEILADPDRFVELEPDTALTLLDQHYAGKRLLLITNSGWRYTRPMMHYAFDRYLPGEMTWRHLFEVVIVSARKPHFFSGNGRLLEVVDDDGLLRPNIGGLEPKGVYYGGNAALVEDYLGRSGDHILYVGDHLFGDVHVTKNVLRWRTALVLRELEREIRGTRSFEEDQRRLNRLMSQKAVLEHQHCQLRLQLQRLERGYGPEVTETEEELRNQMSAARASIEALDAEIAPLARASSQVSHPLWGPLMRAGNDKSMLARQVERSADIYMSRVSNLLHESPFAYLRSHRGSMPHDPAASSE
jgi:HAD superfamily 5'-nucleotidase-like hydrolase